MLNNPLFVIISTCLLFSCKSVKETTDCDLYKRGRFKTHIKRAKYESFTKIVRDDSTQIETNEKTGAKYTFNIKWLSPCRYELVLLEANQEMPDSILQLMKSYPVITTILSGTREYYQFEAKSEGSTHKLVDTMWIDNLPLEKIPVSHSSR
jgi:hypothetical protein